MIRPIPGMPIEDQPEPAVLAMLCWGEARGESVVGKLSVLHVVRTRALKRDTSMKAEALRRKQFSCFNEDDPNRAGMLFAHSAKPATWAECALVVELFLANVTLDPTKGATHYFVTKMDHPPAWGPGHADWVEHIVIGHHTFGTAA